MGTLFKGKSKMSTDIEKLRLSSLDFMFKCHRNEKHPGVYCFAEGVDNPTLYSSTYAAMTKSLYNAMPAKSVCNERAAYINGFQEEDGLFRDPVIRDEGWYKGAPEWCGRWHLTGHVITALTCLGGFVFIKDNPFFYGHRQLSSPENAGAMFPTWFRTLSLAYIGKVLKKSELYSYPWHFIRCPGYQFWE